MTRRIACGLVGALAPLPLLVAGQVRAVDLSPRVDAFGDPLPAGALCRLGTTRFRQGGSIGFVSYALGGQALVSAGTDQVVRVWDPMTGKQIRTLPFELNVLGNVLPATPVALSADGRTVLVALAGNLSLWDLTTGRKVRDFESLPTLCLAVALTPDGHLAAAAGLGSGIHLFDARTGKLLQTLGDRQNHPTSIAFAPNGRVLAVVSLQDGIRLWDVVQGRELRRLEEAPREGAAVCFAPDGRVLAAGSQSLLEAGIPPAGVNGQPPLPFPAGPAKMFGDRHVGFWDVLTGKKLRTFEGVTLGVSGLTFSRDGSLLAAAAPFQGIEVWAVDSGKLRATLASPSLHATCVAFSPDGKAIAAGTAEGTVETWDVLTGKPLHPSAACQGAIRSIAFAPDDRMAACAAADAVRLWNPSSGASLRRFGDEGLPADPGYSTVSALSFSADGAELSGAGRTYCVWRTATGQELRRCAAADASSYHAGAVLSADRRTVAFSTGTQVEVWDAEAGVRRCTTGSGVTLVQALALAPDGRALGLACMDMQGNQPDADMIELRDSLTGQRIRKWATGQSAIAALAFSPDGKVLASAGLDDIRLWQTETGTEIRRLTAAFMGVPRTIAFSLDGRMLAAGGSGREVHVWEVATAGERAVFRGHRGNITCLVFDRGGRRIASGSEDSTALVWDLTGRIPALGGMSPSEPPPPSQAEWEALGDQSASRAYRALWAFVAHPDDSVNFLKDRLRPAAAVAADRLAALIADLDNDSFEIRQRASRQLAALREMAEPALRQTIAGEVSAEVKRRVRELLAQLNAGSGPAQWREIRALEVLERIGTDEARHLLQALAGGAPTARLTQDAQASLSRLAATPHAEQAARSALGPPNP